jgi:hypothetical protein
MPGSAGVDLSKMGGMVTPEQAIELYKANAQMALDIINAAIEGTAKVRRKQFEARRPRARSTRRPCGRRRGARPAIADGGRAGRGAGSAREVDALLGRDVRPDQRDPAPPVHADRGAGRGDAGVKQAKAAMAMLPDLKPIGNVVDAMRGVVGSGSNAFEQMQKVMGDFARLSQRR